MATTDGSPSPRASATLPYTSSSTLQPYMPYMYVKGQTGEVRERHDTGQKCKHIVRVPKIRTHATSGGKSNTSAQHC